MESPSPAVKVRGKSKLRFFVELQQLDVFVPDFESMILESKEPFSGEIFNRSGFAFQLVFVFLAIRANTSLVKFVAVHRGDLFAID